MSQKNNASNVSFPEEQLKKGYLEMAGLNAELAGEGIAADNEALISLEEKLMESE